MGGQNRGDRHNRGGQDQENERWGNAGRSQGNDGRGQGEFGGQDWGQSRGGMGGRSSGAGDDANWRPGQASRSGHQAGEHFGKGPKGYQRSDERIREDVCEALSKHGGLDASDIEVQVTDGEVTLTGTVQDRQAKRAAEEAAEECSGVRDVQNSIRVQSDSMSGRDASGRSGGRGNDSESRGKAKSGAGSAS